MARHSRSEIHASGSVNHDRLAALERCRASCVLGLGPGEQSLQYPEGRGQAAFLRRGGGLNVATGSDAVHAVREPASTNVRVPALRAVTSPSESNA